MRELINAIYQQYPWAGENTASKMAASFRKNRVDRGLISVATAGMLSKSAADEMSRALTEEARAEAEENIAVRAAADTIGDSAKIIMSDTDGLGAITDLQNRLAPAVDELAGGLGNAIGNFTRSMPKPLRLLGKGAEAGLKFGGKAQLFAAGVSGFLATLIKTQNELITAMIEIGIADKNMQEMDKIRRDAALLGMNYKEYATILQVTSDLTASGTENVLDGAIRFGNLANRVAKDETVNRFGMRTKDVTQILAATADNLYKNNQINALTPEAEEKIIKTFAVTQEIALALATATGTNRQELLSQIEAQRTDKELQFSFDLNRKNFIDKYGEEAFDNLQNGSTTFLATIASQFGEDSDLYKQVKQVTDAAVYDIGLDQDVRNNMTEELIMMFNQIRNGSGPLFIENMNAMLTGAMSPSEAVAFAAQLTKTISDAGDLGNRNYAGVDPSIDAANRTMDIAQGKITKNFKQITPEGIQKILDEQAVYVDNADNAIQLVDDFAKTYTQILELLTPTMGSTDAVVDVIYGVAGMVTKVAEFFNTGATYSVQKLDELLNKEFNRQTDMVVYDVGSTQWNNNDPAMRITPDGPITAQSIVNYIANKQTMWNNTIITSKSDDELRDRIEALQELKNDAEQKANTTQNQGKVDSLRHQIRLFEERIATITNELVQIRDVPAGGV